MTVWNEILGWSSFIVGWTYFAAWSLSFYPQVFDNWWRKSVVGLSFDFLVLNIIGHSSYLVFNAVLFWDPMVKEQYHNKYPDKKNDPVKLNDVIFSIHAVALTAITLFQCMIYERGGQVISWTARILCAIILIIIVLCLFLTLSDAMTWLSMMNSLGYVKLSISFFKYVPQAWLNYRRKMTVGWSIGQILLDFAGGMLSFLQMFMDAINKNDWSSFEGGNIPKLGLAFLSIGFDIVFIVQHYILYRKNNQEHYDQLKQDPEPNDAPQSQFTRYDTFGEDGAAYDELYGEKQSILQHDHLKKLHDIQQPVDPISSSDGSSNAVAYKTFDSNEDYQVTPVADLKATDNAI